VTRKLAAQITKTRGQIFDAVHHGKVGTVTYPIMPVFHPSYLSRVADWNVADGAYARTVKDWKKALHIVDLLRHHHYGTPIPRRG
jgi:uracil-DNA glycosylase